MSGNRNPDIQRLLATLNGYSPPLGNVVGGPDSRPRSELHHGQQPTQLPPHPGFSTSSLPGLGYLPEPVAEPKVSTPPPSQHQHVFPQTLKALTPQLGEARSKTSTPTIPEASTITTWPAALKHVTRHMVPDEKIAARIKHLITEQHKHERQWWAGREAIVTRQQGRSGASQQVADLLKSLGGKAVDLAPIDPKADQKELEAYDKKVYAGLLAMTADFDRQLRNLGVPFYSIKHDLVILENGPEKLDAVKGRLDRGELRELQKQMLQTLEDLFAD